MSAKFLVWSIVLALGFPLQSASQWVFQRTLTVPVNDLSNQPLLNPWMGGLNCPQFAAMDLNNDGKEDLVVFDRGYFDAGQTNNGDKLLTFINTGDSGQVSYVYAPQYESCFPALSYFMELQDFNCDGIKDIFTAQPDQINLYLGGRDNNGQLYFTFDSDLLYVPYAGMPPINIFASTTDIPGIGDVNGDGALDIVTFGLLVPSTSYYLNLSPQLGMGCGDTVAFEDATDCWGDIYQLGNYHGVFLDSCYNASDGKAAGEAGPRHNGNTELLFHQHTDTLMDLLLSDIYYNNIDYLRNGGTRDSAVMVYQDTNFPSYDVPINIPTFPATYVLDVNNDGKPDLIAAPNMANASLNLNCAWYYKNVTTDSNNVQFKFQTDTFLVNTTLDFGQGAYPVFFDYNGDGLLDIVVGNYGYFDAVNQYHGGLALLQNVGTADSPAFKLVTKDYLGLSEMTYNGNPMLGLTPTFGDLNGDGKPDMIVGDSSGRLHYFINTSTTDSAVFTLADSNFSGINVSNTYLPDSVVEDFGGYSAPFLYDVNGDGLLDLVIGRYPGNIYYYQNRGTPTQPMFNSIPTNNYFGQIDVRIPGFLEGYSCPIITRLDSTSNVYVLVGNEQGIVEGYALDADMLDSGAFEKKWDIYSGIHEGERTALSVADMDNSGKMSMVVGNWRGGISYFEQIDSIAAGINDAAKNSSAGFIVYPDPAGDVLNIKSGMNLPAGSSLSITDVLGRQLLFQETGALQTGQVVTLNVGNLSTGLYICVLQTAGGTRAVQFMKE